MNVIITGSNGQLGKEFKKYFDKNKINYTATDKFDFDITNLEQMNKFIDKNRNKNISHIINCAAYTNVDESEINFKKAYLINSFAVKNLVEISKKINSELIHFSTDYVFSGDKETYNTNDITNPINNYGKSKAFGEKELKKYNKSYLIRTSWLFGKNGNNFIKKVINWSEKTNVLKIATDEKSSPTYTLDLVKFTNELINKGIFGTYHITNSACTRYEWAEYILKKIGWKGELLKAKREDFKLKAKRPPKSVLNNYKINKVIGIKMPDWENATDRFLKELGYIV